MMSRVKKGIIAGFGATAAVSLLEAVNLLLGPWFMPFPSVIAFMMGMEGNLLVGWIAHFVVGGLILGSAFGVMCPRLPCPRLPTDTSGTKGILFSVGALVVLMTGIFLVGDPSMFSGTDGFGTVAWLLVTHAVFGIVLGTIYGQLVAREKRIPRDMDGAAPAH